MDFIRNNSEATVNAQLFYENTGQSQTNEANAIQNNAETNIAAGKIKSKNKTVKFSTEKDVTYKNLRKLFELHDQLLDISEILNKSYSAQVVTYITASFVVILFGLFFEAKVNSKILFSTNASISHCYCC